MISLMPPSQPKVSKLFLTIRAVGINAVILPPVGWVGLFSFIQRGIMGVSSAGAWPPPSYFFQG